MPDDRPPRLVELESPEEIHVGDTPPVQAVVDAPSDLIEQILRLGTRSFPDGEAGESLSTPLEDALRVIDSAGQTQSFNARLRQEFLFQITVLDEAPIQLPREPWELTQEERIRFLGAPLLLRYARTWVQLEETAGGDTVLEIPILILQGLSARDIRVVRTMPDNEFVWLVSPEGSLIIERCRQEQRRRAAVEAAPLVSFQLEEDPIRRVNRIIARTGNTLDRDLERLFQQADQRGDGPAWNARLRREFGFVVMMSPELREGFSIRTEFPPSVSWELLENTLGESVVRGAEILTDPGMLGGYIHLVSNWFANANTAFLINRCRSAQDPVALSEALGQNQPQLIQSPFTVQIHPDRVPDGARILAWNPDGTVTVRIGATVQEELEGPEAIAGCVRGATTVLSPRVYEEIHQRIFDVLEQIDPGLGESDVQVVGDPDGSSVRIAVRVFPSEEFLEYVDEECSESEEGEEDLGNFTVASSEVVQAGQVVYLGQDGSARVTMVAPERGPSFSLGTRSSPTEIRVAPLFSREIRELASESAAAGIQSAFAPGGYSTIFSTEIPFRVDIEGASFLLSLVPGILPGYPWRLILADRDQQQRLEFHLRLVNPTRSLTSEFFTRIRIDIQDSLMRDPVAQVWTPDWVREIQTRVNYALLYRLPDDLVIETRVAHIVRSHDTFEYFVGQVIGYCPEHSSPVAADPSGGIMPVGIVTQVSLGSPPIVLFGHGSTFDVPSTYLGRGAAPGELFYMGPRGYLVPNPDPTLRVNYQVGYVLTFLAEPVTMLLNITAGVFSEEDGEEDLRDGDPGEDRVPDNPGMTEGNSNRWTLFRKDPSIEWNLVGRAVTLVPDSAETVTVCTPRSPTPPIGFVMRDEGETVWVQTGLGEFDLPSGSNYRFLSGSPGEECFYVGENGLPARCEWITEGTCWPLGNAEGSRRFNFRADLISFPGDGVEFPSGYAGIEIFPAGETRPATPGAVRAVLRDGRYQVQRYYRNVRWIDQVMEAEIGAVNQDNTQIYTGLTWEPRQTAVPLSWAFLTVPVVEDERAAGVQEQPEIALNESTGILIEPEGRTPRLLEWRGDGEKK